ncbi:MAG: hydrolase [Chlamydiales bacterium]
MDLDVYQPYLRNIEKDKDQFLYQTMEWSKIHSYSLDSIGLNLMATHLDHAFGTLNATREAFLLPHGKLLKFTKKKRCKHKILLLGHYDTVYPPENPISDPEIQSSKILKGAGVADMKGGIVVMLAALRAFESSPYSEEMGWTVLLNPDEEIGSPFSTPYLQEFASDHHLGLIFEPAFPDGSLVSARKGSMNVSVTFRGRAAHSGRDFSHGRSAIFALCDAIYHMENIELTEDETLNVGKVEGGTGANIVPEQASCLLNIRSSTHSRMEELWQCIEKICKRVSLREGISFDIAKKTSRMPKPFDKKTENHFVYLRECGKSLGLEINWRQSGGVCDGNTLAEAGLPTIDSLGVVGGYLHSPEEYLLIPSIIERAKLTALFLMRYAKERRGEIENIT